MKKNKQKLNVLIFASYVYGGAGVATAGMHESLLINGVNSRLVIKDNSGNRKLEGKNYIFLKPDIGLNYDEIQLEENQKKNNTIFSLNEPKLNRKTLDKLVKNVDVIVLQWIARFLTAEDIGYLTNLGIPIVMIVRDMNLLAGGCHYFHGCKNWLQNCENCPQLLNDKMGGFPEKIFDIKKKYWNTDNITIVSLSEHTGRIVKRSPILANCPIKVIGNSIDLDIFKPSKDAHLKSNFNLKEDIPTVFHLPSHTSDIKGFYEFLDSLEILKKKHPDFEMQLLVAGSGAKRMSEIGCPYPIIDVGLINDKNELAKLYSCADVTVVPSLAETFSNTAAESVACGTPIVGFDTGAIKEIAGDGLRGKCIELGNVNDFADAVYEVLNSSISSDNCLEFAKQNFSRKKQGEKYTNLFEKLAINNKALKVSSKLNVPLIEKSYFPNLLNFLSRSLQVHNSTCLKDRAFRQQKTLELEKSLQQKVDIIKYQDTIISNLQNSKSFRLGELFFRSVKKPYKMITFPINLLKILIGR